MATADLAYCPVSNLETPLSVGVQGQAISKKSVLGSLDLNPHDFLVCLT